MKAIWHFIEGASIGLIVWIVVNFKAIEEMSKIAATMPPAMTNQMKFYCIAGGVLGALFF